MCSTTLHSSHVNNELFKTLTTYQVLHFVHHFDGFVAFVGYSLVREHRRSKSSDKAPMSGKGVQEEESVSIEMSSSSNFEGANPMLRAKAPLPSGWKELVDPKTGNT